MHRIQVNKIPVSKHNKAKDSGSKPEIRGEKFDAVMDDAKKKIKNSKKEVSAEKTKNIKDIIKKKAGHHSGKSIKLSDSLKGKKVSRELKSLKLETTGKTDKKRNKNLDKQSGKPAAGKLSIKGDGKKNLKPEKHLEIKADRGKEEAGDKAVIEESIIPAQVFMEYRKDKVEKLTGDSKKTENMVVKKSGKKESGEKQVSGHKVIDLRTVDSKKSASAKNDFSGDNTPKEGTAQHDGNKSSGVETFTLSDRSGSSFSSVVQNTAEPKAVLLNELREKLNDRIVKQSSIVLKDENAGEIRLILKPESLGKVRIRLHLDENNLTGRIIVDTPAAKDAFEQNMFRLEKAFTESGFEMGSLDVSVGEKHSGKSKDDGEIISEKVIKIIEDSVPGIDEGIYSSNVIDLVV